jgi:ribosomal protein L21E
MIDVKQKWFIKAELINYAKSQLIQNSNQTDTIKMYFKGNSIQDYKIGDKVVIDIPELFTQGQFIIVD